MEMNLSDMNQDSHFVYCKNYSKKQIIEFVKKIIQEPDESRRYTKERIESDCIYKILLPSAKAGHEKRVNFLKYQDDSNNDIDQQGLDKEIKDSPIKFGRGVIVFHGMVKPNDFKLEKGFSYTFEKYLSCSLFPFPSLNSATNYKENNNSKDRIILILKTNKDINCIMGSASKDIDDVELQKNFTDEQICNIKSQCADEIEILLPRNIQIQIDSISEAICKRTAGKLPNFNFYIIEATILNT